MVANLTTGQAAQLGSQLGFAGMSTVQALSQAGAFTIGDVANHPDNNTGILPSDSPADGSVNAGLSGVTNLGLSRVTPKAGYA